MRPPSRRTACGQAVDEPARVHPGAVRGEGRTARAGDVEPLAGGGGIQPDRAVVPRRRVRGGDPGPGLLRRRAGHDQRPALDEAGAQALLGVDPAHLVDRVAQRGELGQGGACARAARSSVSAPTGHSADTQPPLRPLAPKPTCSASSTSTSTAGLLPQQVVGGPQPGVAAADDDDVRGLRQRSDAGVPGVDGAAVGESHHSGPVDAPEGRPGSPQRWFSASVSTERSRRSISSNSVGPMISGGASCTTGSPRSSARQ